MSTAALAPPGIADQPPVAVAQCAVCRARILISLVGAGTDIPYQQAAAAAAAAAAGVGQPRGVEESFIVLPPTSAEAAPSGPQRNAWQGV
jgi:hypothetical protein